MARGRRPLIALSEAKHIAEKRGEVRHFRHEPDMICNFVIYIKGLVAHVRVRRVERIRITPEGLEQEAADDLAALRFIASSPEISRELWIYTPKGTFRFFRVLANSVAELDRKRPADAGPAAGPEAEEGDCRSGPGRKNRCFGIRAGLTRICSGSTAPPPPCSDPGILRSTDGLRRRKYLSGE